MKNLSICFLFVFSMTACSQNDVTPKEPQVDAQFESIKLAIEFLASGDSFSMSQDKSAVEGIAIKNLITGENKSNAKALPGDILYQGSSRAGAAGAANEALNDGKCVGISLVSGTYTVKEITCNF